MEASLLGWCGIPGPLIMHRTWLSKESHLLIKILELGGDLSMQHWTGPWGSGLYTRRCSRFCVIGVGHCIFDFRYKDPLEEAVVSLVTSWDE